MHLLYRIIEKNKALLLFIVLLIIHTSILAQKRSRIQNTVMDRVTSGVKFEQYHLFTIRPKRSTAQLGAYQSLILDRLALLQLKQQQPTQFQLSIPFKDQVVDLEFIKANILDDSVKFYTVDALGKHVDPTFIPPVFYHGIIKDSDSSFVTATITPASIHIYISYRKQNIQVGSVNDKLLSSNDYGVFEDLPGNNDALPFVCGTNDGDSNPIANFSSSGSNGVQTYGGVIVRCFFDCAYTYFQQNGSAAATYNRITTLFNQAALLYGNESINTSISEIRVWTSADPYDHSSRANGLSSFKNYVQNNYTGNLAMLCDYTVNRQSGLADAIGGLCVAYNANVNGPYIYNDLNYSNSFSNFPVAADAPQTYLIIHEIGHILGSRHTHWCGWTGGPIDNCAPVEGTCAAGPTPVTGTMMSYCCTNSAIRIDFNAGFGTQPGNAIRNFTYGSACLVNGTTICDSSLYLQGPITNTDYTRFEVSNQITSTSVLSAGANVLFDAGKVVMLEPGFHANAGSTLRVLNEGCGGIYAPVIIKKIPKSGDAYK